MTSWFNISCETYVLLRPDANKTSVEAKFEPMLQSEIGENYKTGSYIIGLQPITEIHLGTELPAGLAPLSDPKYSIILGAIALLVLLLGCINFTTLSLGRSLSRAKEVGVRKVVGANKRQIRNQFLGESLLTIILALVVTMGVLPVLLPLFNELLGRELSLEPTIINALFVLALIVILTLFSGSYPALILSRLNPSLIIKGDMKSGGGKQKILRWLIGSQLVLSLFLITCTLIMKSQLNYLQEKNLGFNSDQIVVVHINSPNSTTIESALQKAVLFENELSKQSSVKDIALTIQNFNGSNWIAASFPDENNITHSFNFNVISPEFIPVMGIEITNGKNFTGWDGKNKSGIIINEAFAKQFGWEEPLGKSIPGPEFEAHEVIGVVKDFHYISLHNQIEPLALVVDPAVIFSGINNINFSQNTDPKALVKLQGGQIAEGLEVMKNSWAKVFPSEPYSFTFLDETLQRQYENESRLSTVVTGAAVLAIFIAAMGLFGLSSLIISRRTREIGIRKVLGAETRDIAYMFTLEFLIISFISLALAMPFSIYIMRDWLKEFQYKIDMDPMIFIITAGIAILTCLITVTSQSYKAALQNPVKSIGSD